MRILNQKRMNSPSNWWQAYDVFLNMKSPPITIRCFACMMVSCQREPNHPEKEPELALCVMVLKVVDSRTGGTVSDIKGINFEDSGVETYSSSVPISRTMSTSVARKEGLILASWVAPINGVGGLKIEADGFEPLIVSPLAGEVHRGYSHSFSAKPEFNAIQRTVELKPGG